MANSLLENLSAAAALSGSDLFYVKQGGARGLKATGTQLLTLVGTAYVPLAGGATMTGALTLPAGAVGTPSLMFTGAGATTGIFSHAASTMSFAANGTVSAFVSNEGFQFRSSLYLGWVSSGGANASSPDLIMQRDSAGALALRFLTQQHTLRIYNTYTDASNYERLTLTGVAGTSVNLTAETLGTGGDNLDIVLTPAGGGFVSFPGGLIKLPLNATFRNTDSMGNGLFYMDVSNLVLRRGDAASSFGAILFGGTSSSEPGIKKNGAALDLRLADNSAYTDLKLRNLLSTGYAQIDSGTLTASAPALSITQTWNQGATSFIGIRLNITNTDSAASYPLVVTVNSSDVFFVSKSGDVTASYFKGSLDVGGQGDLLLVRDAAATLALRNGTTQQIFRLYNSYTDASNYERLTLTGVAGASVNLTAETLGTGGDNLDIVLTPAGTGLVKTSGAIQVNGYIKTDSGSVAGLPAASTAGAGARSFVNDANATTFLSTVAAGGANKVPVVSDGTNWLIG